MEENKRFYSLLNDFAFKWIFGQTSNSKLMMCLLNALLELTGEKQIVEITYLDPFNYQQYKDDKFSIVDTRVKDQGGNLYNIELQTVFQKNFTKRSVYYLAKLYSGQLVKGEKYSRLKPSMGISLVNFNLFNSSKKIKETFKFKNSENKIVLNDSMVLNFIDLTKFDTDKPYSLRTPFEKWLHFLRFSEEYVRIYNDSRQGDLGKMDINTVIDYLDVNDEAINLAVNELKKINSNPELRAYLEACEQYDIDMSLARGDGYEEGLNDGKKEGIKEGQLKLLSEMVKEKIISMEQAATKMNMTVTDFNSAINNLSNN